jgi:hypothetical protein
MRSCTRKELQFDLLNQVQDVGNAFQSSSTKFRLLALLLHFIGYIVSSEKADFFKRIRTELILFPVLSLVTGFFFIILLIWKLGTPILLSLLAIFLFNEVVYLFLLNRMLSKLNPKIGSWKKVD